MPLTIASGIHKTLFQIAKTVLNSAFLPLFD
jgi:hypothetical protein